jgi:2-enoate reductase
VEVLLGKKETREIVVVAGGGMVGCETAAFLARQGNKVTIVEMMKRLIPEEINAVSMMGLVGLVKESKVEVLTNTKLLEVTRKGAIVDTGGSRVQLKADSIVLALGFKSESRLRENLKGRVPELFAIGDCVQPRNILNAMWEGFHASRLI